MRTVSIFGKLWVVQGQPGCRKMVKMKTIQPFRESISAFQSMSYSMEMVYLFSGDSCVRNAIQCANDYDPKT